MLTFVAKTVSSHYSNPNDVKQQSPHAHYDDPNQFGDVSALKSVVSAIEVSVGFISFITVKILNIFVIDRTIVMRMHRTSSSNLGTRIIKIRISLSAPNNNCNKTIITLFLFYFG